MSPSKNDGFWKALSVNMKFTFLKCWILEPCSLFSGAGFLPSTIFVPLSVKPALWPPDFCGWNLCIHGVKCVYLRVKSLAEILVKPLFLPHLSAKTVQVKLPSFHHSFWFTNSGGYCQKSMHTIGAVFLLELFPVVCWIWFPFWIMKTWPSWSSFYRWSTMPLLPFHRLVGVWEWCWMSGR